MTHADIQHDGFTHADIQHGGITHADVQHAGIKHVDILHAGPHKLISNMMVSQILLSKMMVSHMLIFNMLVLRLVISSMVASNSLTNTLVSSIPVPSVLILICWYPECWYHTYYRGSMRLTSSLLLTNNLIGCHLFTRTVQQISNILYPACCYLAHTFTLICLSRAGIERHTVVTLTQDFWCQAGCLHTTSKDSPTRFIDLIFFHHTSAAIPNRHA